MWACGIIVTTADTLKKQLIMAALPWMSYHIRKDSKETILTQDLG
jgi:hypothetical protein